VNIPLIGTSSGKAASHDTVSSNKTATREEIGGSKSIGAKHSNTSAVAKSTEHLNSSAAGTFTNGTSMKATLDVDGDYVQTNSTKAGNKSANKVANSTKLLQPIRPSGGFIAASKNSDSNNGRLHGNKSLPSTATKVAATAIRPVPRNAAMQSVTRNAHRQSVSGNASQRSGTSAVAHSMSGNAAVAQRGLTNAAAMHQAPSNVAEMQPVSGNAEKMRPTYSRAIATLQPYGKSAAPIRALLTGKIKGAVPRDVN
jgi:hypothetical protein